MNIGNSYNMQDFKQRYLSLIQCEDQIDASPSVEGLNKLMENHLYKVQFNGFAFFNMDSSIIELDAYRCLDNKLLTGQGGTCFELNASLNELLKQLGYKTYLVEAEMDRVKDRVMPSYEVPTHCTIVVELENEYYLVDVGLGNYFRKPIAFSKEYQDISGKYHLILMNEASQTFSLERFSNKEGKWLSQYRFSIVDKSPIELKPNVDKVCHESCHLSKEFFMIKPYAGDGCKIIDGGRDIDMIWIERKADKEEKRNLDIDSARKLLAEEFNMKADHIDKVLSECQFSNDV